MSTERITMGGGGRSGRIRGQERGLTGGVRTRNEKGKAIQYPRCPNCGSGTGPEDFKSNGVEDGSYFETYRCPVCLEWFSATYDTPDDSGDWTVDPEQEEDGKSRIFFRLWKRRWRWHVRIAAQGRPARNAQSRHSICRTNGSPSTRFVAPNVARTTPRQSATTSAPEEGR